jgi:hypothetical protein
MTSAKSRSALCPTCDTMNRPGAARCYICGRSLTGVEPRAIEPEAGLGFVFARAALGVALVLVFLGACSESITLAVLVILPGGIALIRTFHAPHDQGGRVPTGLRYVAEFAITFGVVILIMVAAVAAFVFTYSGIARVAPGPPTHGAFAPSFSGPGVLLGLVAAIAMTIAIIVAILRFRDGKSDA